MNWTPFLPILLLFFSHCGSTLEQTQRSMTASEAYPEVSSEQLFNRGVAMANNGQLIRAEQYLYLASQSGYPEDQTLPLILKICLSTSRLRTALNYAQPYLDRHPEAWILRYLVASIHLALEHPLKAREQLTQVVRDNPSHAPAYYLLAVISRDTLHDDASTRRYFTAYLRHAPTGTHASEAKAWFHECAFNTRRARHRRVVHSVGRKGGPW